MALTTVSTKYDVNETNTKLRHLIRNFNYMSLYKFTVTEGIALNY